MPLDSKFNQDKDEPIRSTAALRPKAVGRRRSPGAQSRWWFPARAAEAGNWWMKADTAGHLLPARHA